VPAVRNAVARVAADDRYLRVEVESLPDLGLVVRARAGEAVQRDDEGHLAPLEVVDGREAVGQPPDVGQDDDPERAVREVVPHEPESLLPGHAEEVDHQAGLDGDPAEVHGHRRRPLGLDAGGHVDGRAGTG
jgi:hypothetical protein